jgi:hypothetical protein
MNTQRIFVDFPADILLALNETENQLVQRIKLALAVQLYRLAKRRRSPGFQDCSLKLFCRKMKFQCRI